MKALASLAIGLVSTTAVWCLVEHAHHHYPPLFWILVGFNFAVAIVMARGEAWQR